MTDLSLYIHIPFCKHRCAYCDFNTYAGKDALIPEYVSALCDEISAVGASTPDNFRVHTIFFGGGTPSLLSSVQFERIMSALAGNFQMKPQTEMEISLEANPGTCSPEDLVALIGMGFNRISLGMQSSHAAELKLLERIHDFECVIDSVKWARHVGFKNLNLDLIFGLPGQKMETWQLNVQRAVDLSPEHLSLYALTIEPGTPFNRWAARGLIPMPDPDLGADMYEWASGYLESKGFLQYEISNWAKYIPEKGHTKTEMPHYSKYESLHNLQYWRNKPYLGLGAGAHGYADRLRVANAIRIRDYIRRCSEKRFLDEEFPIAPATVTRTLVDRKQEMQETMITGLRLVQEGISMATFIERFGMDIREVFGDELMDLVHKGLLEWVGSGGSDRIRLTRKGRFLSNQVFLQFVG